VTTHKESQITNDPNGYSREVDEPRYIIDLLPRIVTVSLETVRIIAGLPPLDILEENLRCINETETVSLTATRRPPRLSRVGLSLLCIITNDRAIP